jgi:hypothetical protein
MPLGGVGVARAAGLAAFHCPLQHRSLAEELQSLQFLFQFQEALRGGFSSYGHRFAVLHVFLL